MTRTRHANPWAVFALSALVLIADQWTKVIAIDTLASPAHPLVVTGDGTSSAGSLLAARGLNSEEISSAIGQRYLWVYVKAVGLKAGMPMNGADTPRQLLALDGTGFPPPRRLTSRAGDDERTLGQVIAEQWAN